MTRRAYIVVGLIFLAVVAVVVARWPRAGAARVDHAVKVAAQLEGVRQVQLVEAADGSLQYVLALTDGSSRRLAPDAFARLVHDEYAGRGWLYGLLNITAPIGIAWVALGLLGQVLFAGRMIVQWIASERQRRSVVPVAFWWLALSGASMLLVYFIWRRDIVGVLGQATGWFIYMRNLWFIYKPDGGRGTIVRDSEVLPGAQASSPEP